MTKGFLPDECKIILKQMSKEWKSIIDSNEVELAKIERRIKKQDKESDRNKGVEKHDTFKLNTANLNCIYTNRVRIRRIKKQIPRKTLPSGALPDRFAKGSHIKKPYAGGLLNQHTCH